MRIVMFTNTYLPHVGGVARSVSTYEEQFRRQGHDVRVVAPQFDGGEESTDFVLRTPALQRFNGSDFSVTIPQPGLIADFLDDFRPEIVHSHHPFLLGDAALRAAWTRRLPLVFTHHTLYEQYTRYVPLDSEAMQRVAIQMATEYCNLCTHVVAPSESIAGLLHERGVTTPISAIPTGIDLAAFAAGDGRAYRRRLKIPARALVVGHVGRLAAEKNLEYLAGTVARFLKARPEAVFLVVGAGEFAAAMRAIVAPVAGDGRLFMAGSQSGQDLLDAYAAMGVFVFSSQSETQGMVLAEAMAAQTPVVALDGHGVRDVMNGTNGRMLDASATPDEFAAELEEITADRRSLKRLGAAARRSVQDYGIGVCAARMLELYQRLLDERSQGAIVDPGPWDRLRARLQIEWNLLVEKTTAISAAVVGADAVRQRVDETNP